MAMTKTKIIQNIMSVLGHKPVIDLDNPNELVVAIELAYDLLVPAAFEGGSWRFATQIAQLSKLTEEPPVFWKSVFLLPAGFLKLIRVHPQNYSFELFENKRLYTMWDGGEYFMEYIFQPDPSLWPSEFCMYIVYHIADFLALANAQKPEYVPVIKQNALQYKNQALASDNQNRPQNSQVDFPVLSQRHVASREGFSNR